MKLFPLYCLCLLSTLLLMSCIGNQVDPDSEQVITFRGEVEMNGYGSGINGEDLTVQAAKITSSGDLIPIPIVSNTVDSEGNYEIGFDEREALIEAVIVSYNDQRFIGYNSANVKNGNLYYLEPIGLKSTVITNIYRDILKEASSNTVRKSDIINVLRLVDSESLIQEETLTQSIAGGIIQYANARTVYSGSSGSNVGNFDLLLALELMDQAQLNLQRELVVSNNDADISSAYRVFYDRILEALKSTDGDRVNVARITNIQRILLFNSLREIPNAEFKEKVNHSTAYFAALALVDSIEETLEQSRISDTVQNQITQKGNQLLDLVYMPEGNEEELALIFNQFSDEVISIFKSDQLVDGDVIDTMLSSINGADGPRAQFKNEIKSGTSALALIGVHDDFLEKISEAITENSNYGDVNRDVLTNIVYLSHIY